MYQHCPKCYKGFGSFHPKQNPLGSMQGGRQPHLVTCPELPNPQPLHAGLQARLSLGKENTALCKLPAPGRDGVLFMRGGRTSGCSSAHQPLPSPASQPRCRGALRERGPDGPRIRALVTEVLCVAGMRKDEHGLLVSWAAHRLRPFGPPDSLGKT